MDSASLLFYPMNDTKAASSAGQTAKGKAQAGRPLDKTVITLSPRGAPGLRVVVTSGEGGREGGRKKERKKKVAMGRKRWRWVKKKVAMGKPMCVSWSQCLGRRARRLSTSSMGSNWRECQPEPVGTRCFRPGLAPSCTFFFSFSCVCALLSFSSLRAESLGVSCRVVVVAA